MVFCPNTIQWLNNLGHAVPMQITTWTHSSSFHANKMERQTEPRQRERENVMVVARGEGGGRGGGAALTL